jgi:hypothetical protein
MSTIFIIFDKFRHPLTRPKNTSQKPDHRKSLQQNKKQNKNSPRLPPNFPPNPIILLKPLPIQHALLCAANAARANLVDVQAHRAVFDILLHGGGDCAVRRSLPHEPAHSLHFQHGVHGV